MIELSTTQIAARLGVSERTIQRWIQDKKLPAQEISKHRYLIDERDLQALTLPQPGDTLQDRVSELERRVSDLGRISLPI